MPDFTPGPWKLSSDKPQFGFWGIRQDPKDWDGNGYQAIFSVPASTKGTHYGEMFRANAHLIAAAPELYMAAQLACLMFERKNLSTAESDWMGDDEHEAWSALRAALKKARGEA
jgi:hypothetical protein